MPNNIIQVTYKVNDDGSLEKISQKAKKVAGATNEAASASDRYNKAQKGVAGATSNSTKAFSKMNSGLGGSSGLVAAYATFAANIFALTAAFGALQRAAQLSQLEEGFNRLANSSGRTASIMVSSIQSITNEAVSANQAMRTAAMGFSAGFSTDQIEGLTKVAKGASIALGRDLPDALDRLVRGTAKLEPEILDELGIFVRLDDAVEQYADTLGKAGSELTQTERRQAFLNATLSQGILKFGQIGDSIDTNPYDKLAANFKKISDTALNIFSTVLGPAISFLASNTMALLGVLILFGSTLASSLLPTLTEVAKKQGLVADSAKRMAEEEAKAGKKFAQKEKIAFVRDDTLPKTKKGVDLAAVTKLKSALKKNTVEAKDFETALSKVQALRKQTETIAKKNKTTNTDAHKQRIKELDQLKNKIIKVQMAEQGRGSTSGKSALAAGIHEGEKGVENTLENMAMESNSIAGLRNQYSLAREGFGKFRADQSKGMAEFVKTSKFWPGLGQKIFGAFRTAGVGARLFGAALINAIPLIGQIIFVVGLAVEGLVSLYQWFNKPTEAEKALAEVTGNLTEKMEQLAKTNDTLETGLRASYIQIAINEAGIKGLTDATLEAAIAQADSAAKVQAYANKLKVNAGIVTEFSSAVKSLGTELQNQDIGLLGVIGNWISNTGSSIFAKFTAQIADLTNWIGGFSDEIVEAWTTLDRISGGKLSKFLKDNPITEFVTTTADSFDKAQWQTKMDNFTDATMDAFREIEKNSPDASAAILKSIGKDNFADFITDSFAKLDLASLSAEERAGEFQKVISLISGKLQVAAVKAETASASINKFGENVSQGSKNLREFARSVLKSNKFTGLIADVDGVAAAVKALARTAADSNGEITFADSLAKEIKNKTIDLAQFGVTFDEVVSIMEKGPDTNPFVGIKDKLLELQHEASNGANELNTLKTSLQNAKNSFENTKALTDYNNKLATLAKTGKFEITGAQNVAGLKAEYDLRLALIKKEEEIKNSIAEKEQKLQLLSLDFLILQTDTKTAAGIAQVANLKEQKSIIGELIQAQQKLNAEAADTAERGAKASFYTDQDANAAGAITAAGKGDTSLARMQNFQEAGGFAALDKKNPDGTPIIGDTGKEQTNFGGKIQAMGSQLSPMIEDLKKLGPEGELVAAVTAGALAIGDAFGSLADKMNAGTATTADKLGAVGAAIGAVGGMLAASSKAKIAGIDAEIAAEQKRDGKSAESVAKIKGLEKKKEAAARKAFEMNKKMQMAGAVISTASAVMGALGMLPWTPANPIIAGMMAAMGAAQLAIISGTSFQGGGSSSDTSMPTSIAVGNRQSSVDLAKARSPSGELGYARGAQGTGSGMTNYTPSAFTGMKYRATGGNTSFMVGEQGPEIFTPERPGRITPADDTANMGSSTNVTFTINAIDSRGIEDVLNSQRGNLVGIIREAANAHGESFLENVNVESYQGSAGGPDPFSKYPRGAVRNQ